MKIELDHSQQRGNIKPYKMRTEQALDLMLYAAALKGDVRMCRLALEWGGKDVERMLEGGVRGNHRDVCVEAKRCGAKNYEWMHRLARYCGRFELAELALDWYCDELREKQSKP